MSKKKKVLLAIAILSIILLSFIGGQSYSKYVTQVKGEGMVDVATWNFKVNGSTEERQTISLASTSYNPVTLADGKIAPGTEGKFNIVVDGSDSEVRIWYTISIQKSSSAPRNLYFKFAGNKFQANELNTVVSASLNVGNTYSAVKTFPIEWHWDYETDNGDGIEASDIIDTEDAKNAQEFTFDVIVRAQQLQPEKV